MLLLVEKISRQQITVTVDVMSIEEIYSAFGVRLNDVQQTDNMRKVRKKLR